MSPSRALLNLCVLLLLALVATSASAEAPVYDADEVAINIAGSPQATTRFEQIATCSTNGGALVPMVTDAVYSLVSSQLNTLGITDSFSYMGGSSMLSSSECTSNTPSLSCVWYWDQGRYEGASNAVAFYKGNRVPSELRGAKMIGTTVGNYWYNPGGQLYPGSAMLRYGAVVRKDNGSAFWTDSSEFQWVYSTVCANCHYKVCAVDKFTMTANAGNADATESSSVNLPLVIGLPVGAAIILIVTIAVIIGLVYCGGCSCTAGAPGVAPPPLTSPEPPLAYDGELEAVLSRRGSMLQTNSFHSRGIDMDALANRSFHAGPLRKNGSNRYSGVGVFDDEVTPWQNDAEMAAMTNGQYMRA